MELYIGGFAQGKLGYVKAQNPECLVFEDLESLKNSGSSDGKSVKVLNRLHLVIKKMLLTGIDPEVIKSEILQTVSSVSGLIIICDEIGCGIVPIDETERLYRELTGRILVEIAKKADRVVRISCGIPQAIK